jgi:hypothetical protein
MGFDRARPSRRGFVTAAGALVASAAAWRATASPAGGAEAFVAEIYSHYQGTDAKAPGVRLDKPSDYRRYFEPSLVAIILADQERAARHDEVPTLDGDPFVDAQDWDISEKFWSIIARGPARADAEVHFSNFKQPQKVLLQLVRLKVGWRIHDIVYYGDDAGTLRGLYKHK